jgi:hypothetical protein
MSRGSCGVTGKSESILVSQSEYKCEVLKLLTKVRAFVYKRAHFPTQLPKIASSIEIERAG